MPALHSANASQLTCLAADFVCSGGLDMERLGYGWEIEDLLRRLMAIHQVYFQQLAADALARGTGDVPTSVPTHMTEISGSFRTVLPNDFQIGEKVNLAMSQGEAKLKYLPQQLLQNLPSDLTSAVKVRHLIEQNALSFTAKLEQNIFVRNVTWPSQSSQIPPPLTKEMLAQWLQAPTSGAGWCETSLCLAAGMSLCAAAETVQPTRHFFEPRFKQPPPIRPLEGSGQGLLPIAPLIKAPGQASSPDLAVFGTSVSRVARPVATSRPTGQDIFPNQSGPSVFFLTFGVAYVGQGPTSMKADHHLCQELLSEIQQAQDMSHAISESQAAEIVSTSLGYPTIEEALAAKTVVVALNSRFFGSPDPDMKEHTGLHPQQLRRLVAHDNFPSWLRSALQKVAAARQLLWGLPEVQQHRLYTVCYDDQGCQSAATQPYYSSKFCVFS